MARYAPFGFGESVAFGYRSRYIMCYNCLCGKRNITFNFPQSWSGGEVYAAEHDTTINAMVRDLLQEALSRESRARAAADQVLRLADRGPYFTADPGTIRREELHERR